MQVNKRQRCSFIVWYKIRRLTIRLYSHPLTTGHVDLCAISTPLRAITVLQPFWRIELIVHIAISVLPGTNLHLSQVNRVRIKWLAKGTQTLKQCLDVERGERNILFHWKLASSHCDMTLFKWIYSKHHLSWVLPYQCHYIACGVLYSDTKNT